MDLTAIDLQELYDSRHPILDRKFCGGFTDEDAEQLSAIESEIDRREMAAMDWSWYEEREAELIRIAEEINALAEECGSDLRVELPIKAGSGA